MVVALGKVFPNSLHIKASPECLNASSLYSFLANSSLYGEETFVLYICCKLLLLFFRQNFTDKAPAFTDNTTIVVLSV